MNRRRPQRKSSPVRRLLVYIGIAVGFAAIGFAASLASGPSSPSAKTEFTAVPGRPSAIAVTRDAIYLADDQSGSVVVLDPSTIRLRGAPVSVGTNPVALTTGEGSLFVGHASGDLTRVTSQRVTGRAHIGGSITGLAFDGRHVWAADLGRSELEEVDPRSLRVVRRIHGVSAVRAIAVGREIWATTANDEVVRYRTKLERVRVGPGPIGLASDGHGVWVAISDGQRVVRLNATSMRVSARVRVGHGPVNVAVLRGVVWVTNNDDRTLTRIDVHSARVIGAAIGVASNLRGAAAADRVWFAGTDPSGIVRGSER